MDPNSVSITLLKFEPVEGSPDEPNYRSARLSYRINVPGTRKVEFPTINFAVEAGGGKLFERRFALPAGSAFLEPGEGIERTVALDPSPRDDWAAAHTKAEKATFSWSIEGQGSGQVEMPLHKAWP